MPLVKRGAADSAGADADARPFAAVLAELGHADPDTRRSAARQLAAYPAAGAALCAAAITERTESVREAIFTALMRIATPDVAAALVPLLQSEDVALRNAAVEALQHMPHAFGEYIAEVLAGPTRTRILGVGALSMLSHPNNLRWLTAVIEHDPEVNVCCAAVDALAECGDAGAAAPLQRLLERFPNEPFLEFSVRTALAQIASL